MHSRILARFAGKQTVIGPATASEFIQTAEGEVRDFNLQRTRFESLSTVLGHASRMTLTGRSGSIEKTEMIDSYQDFPAMLFIQVTYRNIGQTAIHINGWTNCSHSITAGGNPSEPKFWSLESGSYEKRPDWVVPLTPGFSQQNYLGMNASDYGGGTPVVDVWRRDVGLAVGHVELVPELVSLPVSMPAAKLANVAVEYHHPRILQPGESLASFHTFVAVHQGDYFSTLRDYRRVMIRKGVQFSRASSDAFQPIWCAWGFGRNFRPEQIVRALPTAKALGFKWVTVDDGWQTAEGDWQPNPKKFPRGDADMRALVNKIHAEGLKAQLWWSPMSVSPSAKLFRDHPDWLLLDENGVKRKISWWDSYYLCPAVPAVVAFHQKLAQKMIRDWGFDGLKIDGQFLNAAPRCTNPAHHHSRPEDSVEAVPYFFRAIENAVRAVKPDALIELCPCGTAYSFYSMPYYNMSVASDPETSWQVRSKGKTLKALMGDKLPYFGDHVELSDGGMDFASTIGVGGVIGTEFRWPADDHSSPPSDADAAKLALTPEKRNIWAEWVRIYRENMLSNGEYLGDLYDIGFDKPEAHCIRKGNTLYYAFYAKDWNGPVELRGLGSDHYQVTDYVNRRPIATVQGPRATVSVSFHQSLLLEASPRQTH